MQELLTSFQADFKYFVSQIHWFFEVLVDQFSNILGLGTQLFHYLGDHWVQRCIQTGPELIFSNLGRILGLPLEDRSGSCFHIFSDLNIPKSHLDCSHVFCWFLYGNSGEFWCPDPSKVLYILMFSLDFTFSEFLLFWRLWVPLGTSFWWLWEVLGDHSGDFLVYWKSIEISLIFRTTQIWEPQPGGW